MQYIQYVNSDGKTVVMSTTDARTKEDIVGEIDSDATSIVSISFDDFAAIYLAKTGKTLTI